MTTQRQLDAMLNELRPQLQEALLAAFADMQSGVDYPALELAIAQRDAAGVEAALNIDDVRQRLTKAGVEPLIGPSELVATVLKSKIAQWAEVIHRAGISAQ